jgi:hypothetical protein
VVKLFTPDAGATWLLTEIDPDDHDHAFGLCDLGLGMPEIGWVSLGELATVRGRLGLPIERDLSFRAEKRLSAYARDARLAGRSSSEPALGAPQGAPCAFPTFAGDQCHEQPSRLHHRNHGAARCAQAVRAGERQPLRFKIGDAVIYTNEFGAQFRRRVTGFYQPTEPSGLYARRRYYLNSTSPWMPVAESSLRPDDSA